MKVVIIGNTGFIGNSIYSYLGKNKEYDLIGISKNEIDLSQEKSSIPLSKHFSVGVAWGRALLQPLATIGS